MQPKQIHELLDNFYKRPVEAVELVKKMLVSNDESTFAVWVENEKSNKFDSACDLTWPSNNLEIYRPNWPRLTIFCNTCGIVNSAPICLQCFMRSNSNRSHSEKKTKSEKEEKKIEKEKSNAFEDLKIEPHPNHDVYFKFMRSGHCSCGDKNSMNKNFFCSYHTLQPTSPPNVEIFGSDHCDFITDLTDICFRSLIIHGPHSEKNVECIVNFLLDLTRINSSYLHLIAAALSENFDSSALFTHWPQFLTKNAVSITKLIEVLSVDDSFQYSFATSFYDNYIYLLSYDLNIIESINPSSLPTSAIPLLAIADIAWGFFINNEEMIEDFSIAELIGKEFYILTSFVRSDPFHPIVSHSLIRDFFNTMNTFFSSSDRFFKTLTSPESISKITDIYIDALSLETFPIVTKKFNFYDFERFSSSFKFLYGCNEDDLSYETSSSENKENDEKQEKKLFSSSDDLASFFVNEEVFNYNTDSSKKADKYSPEKHLFLRNFIDKIDPRYQFVRCALKFKKNLFCAIEHLSDLFQSPELFIMPLLCGMIKTFFSTMSPDQFTFHNDFLSSIASSIFNDNLDSNSVKADIKSSENLPPNKINKKSEQNQNNPNVSNNDDDSVTVNNLLKLQLNENDIQKKRFIKPKNILDKIHFTHYYESKEPFYVRSVLDELPLLSCSAPCHSIAFRKFCKYSTKGIEDWRKAIKEANIYEIMFSNSNFLRNTFKFKSNKDIENELDQGVKLYLEDIALLTVTIIPMRICALSSLLSIGVAKADNKLIKQQLLKPKSNHKNIPYDNLLRSIFSKNSKKSGTSDDQRKNKKPCKLSFQKGIKSKSKNKKSRSNNNNITSDDDDDDENENIDYEDEDYEDDYNYDIDDIIDEDEDLDDENENENENENEFEDEDEDENEDENNVSNDLYYNLFLKYADFSYDIIGSYAGSICALSFASNIGYLSLVTYCIFDLKNGITSKKLFVYLNFLICCVSDRSVYAKDDEKLCWFFIRNLLSKRGKMSGAEILSECDKFFTKKNSSLGNENSNEYYVQSQNLVDDLLFEENDFEDVFIENKMYGKQIDELDSFELLSGKCHSFCKKLTNRFSRQIINKILNEIAEPISRFDTSTERSDFNQIIYKLRDEFNEFKPSIFNTAQEAFDQWSILVQKYPIDAFMKITFDNEYKPGGFSPQSVLLTSEFNTILFITALEATNSKKNDGFDKETIHIFFAILNYINQLTFTSTIFDISNTNKKVEVKNIVANNINDLINSMPSTFSQFQTTSIKFKNYPETTFNDLLLKFGEIGNLFINQSNGVQSKVDQKSPEQKKKPNFDHILDIFKQKQLNYLKPFAEKIKIDRYFSISKSDKSSNFLITIPILIFDGFSGRQMWASSSSFKQIQQASKIENQTEGKIAESFAYHCTSSGRSNSWIPANLDPSFQSLNSFVDDDLKDEKKQSFVDLFIKQFGCFNPEKNLFNIIQNTIENVELRLRSNPFAIEDSRPKILLGNAFRILWTFVQKKLKQNGSEKVEILVNRTFNYRNNDLWDGSGMSDASVLTPLTNRITFLLSLLLISKNPSESFFDLLNIAFNIDQNGKKDGRFTIEFNGFNFIIENFDKEINENSSSDDDFLGEKIKIDDDFSNLVFLRCSFIIASCCLWVPIEKPNSLFDPNSESAIADLYSLLLKKDFNKENENDNDNQSKQFHFFNRLDIFSFVDLPSNFFGFAEFPFAAEILNNNIMSTGKKDEQDFVNKKSSSSLDFEYRNPGLNESKNVENDDSNSELNQLNNKGVLIKNDKYLENKQMMLIKSDILNKFRMKKKNRKINFLACCEAVDLMNGYVDDFDTLCANSDSNCSILISLSGKDAGLCYVYNKSLDIESQIVEPVYLTLFGDSGIKSGELLYLKKDRILKLQDSFLSGELFL